MGRHLEGILRLLLTLAFTVMVLPVLPADSIFETSRELPGYYVPGTWAGTFSLVNDAAGSDFVVEWDDARTAGYELFLRTPIHLYMEIAYSGYTYRSTAAEPALVSREDSIHIVLGGIWDGNLWGGRYRAMIGAGGLFFGNYYGYTAQTWLHEALGQDRPIPPEDSYSDPDWTALISTEVGITVPGGWPVSAALSFTGNTRGFLELETTLGLVLESPFGASHLDAAWRFIDEGDSTPAFSRYLSDSRGLWIEYEFRALGLYTKYSINPAGGLSQGALGFSFTGASRATPGALWQGAFRNEFSFTFGGSGFINRVSWTPTGWQLGKSVFSLSGILYSGGEGSSDTYQRFQKTLIGAEWSLPLVFGSKAALEPFAGLSMGYWYRKDYDPIDQVYLATVTATEWMALGRVDAGFRFSPVIRKQDGRSLEYGMVVGFALDAGFPTDDPFDTAFYLGISFSDRPATDL